MPKSVLLVDDSPAVRVATRTYLHISSNFHICGEAADGIEGVEKAQQLSPDLIVMDLSMPRMNGLEASRKLARILPHVPIILLTSYKSVLNDAEIAGAGISSVVSKADSPELLKNVIETLLDTPSEVIVARRRQMHNGGGFGY